jgi:hypothetical protein
LMASGFGSWLSLVRAKRLNQSATKGYHTPTRDRHRQPNSSFSSSVRR